MTMDSGQSLSPLPVEETEALCNGKSPTASLCSDQVKDQVQVSDNETELNDDTHDSQEQEAFTPKPLLSNGVYLNIKEMESLKEANENLIQRLEWAEKENARIAVENDGDSYKTQITYLEKLLEESKSRIGKLESHLKQRESEDNLRLEKKQLEVVSKERDSMVVKYAQSEREVLGFQKERDNFEKKLKEASKEREILLGKIKNLNGDTSRVGQLLDSKCHELSLALKEVEKMKDEINSREIKVRWAHNKLKAEMESHKEAQTKLEKLQLRLSQVQEEAVQVRKDYQSAVQTAETATLESREANVQEMKDRISQLTDENNSLSMKVQALERDRLTFEENLSRLKEVVSQQQGDVAEMNKKLKDKEDLQLQLDREKSRVVQLEEEVTSWRALHADLQGDISSCRQREAELLSFTQTLTEKHVRLQSDLSGASARAEYNESQVSILSAKLGELEKTFTALKSQNSANLAAKQNELAILARHLAEKTRAWETLQQSHAELQGELEVAKRKHQASRKELTRELKSLQRRFELVETHTSSHSLDQNGGHSGTSLGSRSSSHTSLNTMHCERPSSPSSTSRFSPSPTPHPLTQMDDSPQTQALLERLLSVQKQSVKKSQKLDFMEEHVQQLVEELKKKNKLIQWYIMREESGALASTHADEVKAELSKHGGVMASLYGSKQDQALTLELSMEISRKLQAVLEDTLLKNITLKENLNTMGEEIARLTMQRRT